MAVVLAMIFVGAKVGSIGLGIYGMVGVAAKFLKRHPSHITFYAPFVTWLFCFLAGTAHTRPQFHGEAMSMNSIIEIIMMSIAALIQLVGKADVGQAVKGNVFASGMNAMVAIFGVLLFVFSIMLFSQAATVKTLYPVGLALGVPPQVLLALFPAVNGYFFLPNYPTEVAAIGFDRTGTTTVGKYVINHSFQLSGFITTFVSIGVGYLLCCCLLTA